MSKRKKRTNAEKKAKRKKLDSSRGKPVKKSRVVAQDQAPSKKQRISMHSNVSLDWDEVVNKRIHLNLKDSYNWAVIKVAGAGYTYGTFFKLFAPELYGAHLDSLDQFAKNLGIPYDPEFQANYLGSFAGSIFYPAVASGLFYSLRARSLNANNPSDTIPDSLLGECVEAEKKSTRDAFLFSASGLTGFEVLQSFVPNRSFDYGDMTTYGLGLMVYATVMAIASKRIKKFQTAYDDVDDNTLDPK